MLNEMEILDRLELLSGETDGNILDAYLDEAKESILNRRYPFGDRPEEFPTEYINKAIKIAVYLLNKRGAEGETTHKENGIDRTYGSADVPTEMLSDIIPLAKVVF